MKAFFKVFKYFRVKTNFIGMDWVEVQVFLGWTLANHLSITNRQIEETDHPILNQYFDIMSSILEQKYQTQKI